MTKPKTLSSAHPHVTLTGTINAYGSVDIVGGATYDAAVFGPATAAFTVINDGLIESGPRHLKNDAGLLLAARGTVTNNGTIIGGTGVLLQGTAAGELVTNDDLITGSYFAGVELLGKGLVLNFGTLSGQTFGVDLKNSGTVTNDDIITAGTAGTGIYLAQGAASQVTNNATITAGTGIAIGHGTGATVTNDGTILGTTGIQLAAGTIHNDGYIDATGTGATLQAGGTVDNAGLITSGGSGIAIKSGTVLNTGSILVHGFADGIYIGGTAASAYIGKTGFISAGTGILLSAAGHVTNAGSIETTFGNGIFLLDGGTVTNSGFISATEPILGGGVGIVLQDGGVIDNTGTIYGAAVGIDITQGGTVIDSGSIANGFHDAIYFNTGGAALSRLILAPTAHTTGTIQLNGAALNLAAATGKIGTFAPESQSFLNAGPITIDPHAVWDFSGTFTAGSTIALVNDGTIKLSAADLITIDGPITGTGLIDLSKKPLTLNGSAAGGEKISFTGTSETLALGDPQAFHAKIEKFALGDTIDLTSIALSAITATHFAAGVLTLDESTIKLEFTFANPATFGSGTFKLTAAGPGTDITLAPAAALLPVTHLTTLMPLATLGS